MPCCGAKTRFIFLSERWREAYRSNVNTGPDTAQQVIDGCRFTGAALVVGGAALSGVWAPVDAVRGLSLRSTDRANAQTRCADFCAT